MTRKCSILLSRRERLPLLVVDAMALRDSLIYEKWSTAQWCTKPPMQLRCYVSRGTASTKPIWRHLQSMAQKWLSSTFGSLPTPSVSWRVCTQARLIVLRGPRTPPPISQPLERTALRTFGTSPIFPMSRRTVTWTSVRTHPSTIFHGVPTMKSGWPSRQEKKQRCFASKQQWRSSLRTLVALWYACFGNIIFVVLLLLLFPLSFFCSCAYWLQTFFLFSTPCDKRFYFLSFPHALSDYTIFIFPIEQWILRTLWNMFSLSHRQAIIKQSKKKSNLITSEERNKYCSLLSCVSSSHFFPITLTKNSNTYIFSFTFQRSCPCWILHYRRS